MTETVYTQLRWTAEMAKQDKAFEFQSLANHIGVDFLRESFRRLATGKAPGVDGVTKAQYGLNLEENLAALHTRLKENRYRAPEVKRVWIPKEGSNKEKRPLGLPTLEDKIVQGAVKMMLESIYEQDFKECSYGFRPKRSCHQAIAALREGCLRGMRWLIDADISKCFDSFDRQTMQELLSKRIKDGAIKRLVGKWMNAGVMDGNEIIFPERGTPQGGSISPLLANVYLHYVLDEWYEKEVQPRCKGRSFLVRYADDFVIGCELKEDAEKILEVLPKRFTKYHLTIHPDKTRLVDFRAPTGEESKGNDTFAFLGFRFCWARSRQGVWVVKKLTDRKRLARTKKRINEWCRRNRHRPIKEQAKVLTAKLRGHYQYYGVIGNFERLSVVYHWTKRCWQKWLNRRGGSKMPLTFERFGHLTYAYPLLKPRIMCSV